MIQIKVSTINVIEMSLIIMMNWIFIFIFENSTHLSYLDHSTYFYRTILLPLRSLKYISNQDQGQIKVIKINVIDIEVIKIHNPLSRYCDQALLIQIKVSKVIVIKMSVIIGYYFLKIILIYLTLIIPPSSAGPSCFHPEALNILVIKIKDRSK